MDFKSNCLLDLSLLEGVFQHRSSNPQCPQNSVPPILSFLIHNPEAFSTIALAGFLPFSRRPYHGQQHQDS